VIRDEREGPVPPPSALELYEPASGPLLAKGSSRLRF
jgi:hypothetical protein